MELTKEQKEIIALSKTMQNNEILAIQACAGSGKTSTLREIAMANPNARFLYLAFNKAIIEESKSKFPQNVELKTIHSLAYSYTASKLGKFAPESKLTYFHIKDYLDFKDFKDASMALRVFDSFLRSNKGLEHYSPFVKIIFDLTLERKIPITHNFYLKFYQMEKNKQLDKKYNYILLDEAQDTNPTMLSVFLDNNCKKILVGDTFQNIYGFNNTINAFEVVKANHYATLSQSFRCKQEILDYANFLLEKFSTKKFKAMTSGFKESADNAENKAYIMRTNTGIINFIDEIKDSENLDEFGLIKEPNAIFAPVWAIVNFLGKKFDFIPKEYAYLKQLNSKEELFEYIKQSYDNELRFALQFLTQEIDLKEIHKLATALYRNKNATKIITNAHQSKGLEWDIVILGNDFADFYSDIIDIDNEGDPKRKFEKEFQFQQELNLFYVAITRAKRQLIDNSKNLPLYQHNIKKGDKTISGGYAMSRKTQKVKRQITKEDSENLMLIETTFGNYVETWGIK